jgi:hypothetical protein
MVRPLARAWRCEPGTRKEFGGSAYITYDEPHTRVTAHGSGADIRTLAVLLAERGILTYYNDCGKGAAALSVTFHADELPRYYDLLRRHSPKRNPLKITTAIQRNATRHMSSMLPEDEQASRDNMLSSVPKEAVPPEMAAMVEALKSIVPFQPFTFSLLTNAPTTPKKSLEGCRVLNEPTTLYSIKDSADSECAKWLRSQGREYYIVQAKHTTYVYAMLSFHDYLLLKRRGYYRRKAHGVPAEAKPFC